MSKNVNINIRIDPELRHRLNVVAAQADMSVSSMITAQIEAVLRNGPRSSLLSSKSIEEAHVKKTAKA